MEIIDKILSKVVLWFLCYNFFIVFLPYILHLTAFVLEDPLFSQVSYGLCFVCTREVDVYAMW